MIPPLGVGVGVVECELIAATSDFFQVSREKRKHTRAQFVIWTVNLC